MNTDQQTTPTPEQVQEWKEKAEQWDNLKAAVRKFYQRYPDGMPVADGDVQQIGCLTADAMGFYPGYTEQVEGEAPERPLPTALNIVL